MREYRLVGRGRGSGKDAWLMGRATLRSCTYNLESHDPNLPRCPKWGWEANQEPRGRAVVDGVKEVKPFGREDTKARLQPESLTPGMTESALVTGYCAGCLCAS